MRSCACIMSTNCAPTRITGLRAFIALWKTIETLRQRNRRSSSLLLSVSSSPRNRTLPPTMPRGRAQDLHDRVRDGALAAARLAGEPDDLAGPDRQVDAVDRADGPLAAVLDRELAHLDEDLGAGADVRPGGRRRDDSAHAGSPPGRASVRAPANGVSRYGTPTGVARGCAAAGC